jgi:hypothetical protein
MNNFEHDRIDYRGGKEQAQQYNRLLEVQGPRNLEYLYPNYLLCFEISLMKAIKEGIVQRRGGMRLFMSARSTYADHVRFCITSCREDLLQSICKDDELDLLWGNA